MPTAAKPPRPYVKSGALITEARKAKGLNQEDVARELGLSNRQRVQNWERGKVLPRPALLKRLGELLGLSADEITLGERLSADQRGPTQQQDLGLTPDGVTIGRIWEGLPRAGRDYIAEQLAAMLRFQSEDRDMAAHVFRTPSADAMKRLKDHEKVLEMKQIAARRKSIEEGK